MRCVKPYGKDLNIKNPHTSEDDHGDPEEPPAKHTAAEVGESAVLTMNDSVMFFWGYQTTHPVQPTCETTKRD